MHSINWRLRRLFPGQGDSFATLSEWFRTHRFLDYYYGRGNRYHKGNIQQFTSADLRDARKQGIDRTDVQWREQLARRLFGMRRVVVERATEMDKFCKENYDFSSRLNSHFWLIKNCKPYCGEWYPEEKVQLTKGNPTGKFCFSRLCPWCYMRQMDRVSLAARTPAGSAYVDPESYTGKKLQLGIGLPEKVTVTLFDLYHEVDFNAGSPYLQFNQGHDALAEFNKKAAVAFYRNTQSDGRYPKYYKLVSPLYFRRGDGQLMTGVRVAFIHAMEINTEVIAKAQQQYPWASHVTTQPDLEVKAAVRYAMPFPVLWLEDEHNKGVKLNILTTFHRCHDATVCNGRQRLDLLTKFTDDPASVGLDLAASVVDEQ